MTAPLRSRILTYELDSDEWLIDAARRFGYAIPRRDRPAGTSAWRMLLNAGLDDEEVLRLACTASGVEAADLSRVSPASGAFLPRATALKYRVAPLGVRHGILDVATFNPRSTALERELAFASKHRVGLHAASPAAVLRAQAAIYSTVYGTSSEIEPSAPPAPPAPRPSGESVIRPPQVARLSLALPAETDAELPEPDLAERLLSIAVAERASEAHLEPAPDGELLIRLRIDGTLRDRFAVSASNAPRVLQSLRARAGLDTTGIMSPRGGRATFSSARGPVMLQVTTEPHMGGVDKMIVRVHAVEAMLGLRDLGLADAEQFALDALLATPHGLVLVVGSAASGKTTTLYAAAQAIQQGGRAVVTVEEPIERMVDGIAQVQVSESRHPTFAAAVRASLLADVPVVVVGALADAATTELVVAAGREPTLVLSALDTSDMASAVQRLHDMDVDSHALSTALTGIVAQCLLRRLCDSCATPVSVDDLPEAQRRLVSALPTVGLRQPVGCGTCRGTGYSGRMAIMEVVHMTPELKAAVARRADAPALAQLARECGISNLWDAGIARVVQGTTSLGELLDHVVPPAEVGEGTVMQQDIDALLAQLLG